MEGSLAPATPEEFFNMKHSSARNVIERCFGLLKLRWAILRSPSYYPVKTHSRIIIACCLLHNLIRREMPTNPLEHQLEIHTAINLNEVDASAVQKIVKTEPLGPNWPNRPKIFGASAHRSIIGKENRKIEDSVRHKVLNFLNRNRPNRPNYLLALELFNKTITLNLTHFIFFLPFSLLRCDALRNEDWLLCLSTLQSSQVPPQHL